MVDPSAFLFAPSAEEQLYLFLASPLGVQVTDPGQAINVGSAIDVQRAQALLGKGCLSSQAQGAAASGHSLGQQQSNILVVS